MEPLKELVREAVHDDEAFVKLYRIFYPKIYGFVFAKLKDSEAADDVTSEVFIKTMLHLDSYREKSSFSTWITSIAVQEVARYCYKKGRRREMTWEEFFDVEDLSKNRPEEVLLHEEAKRELLKALDDLSARERQLVELRYFAELSQKEIAEQMDLTPSNVGVILHRAIDKLRKKRGDKI